MTEPLNHHEALFYVMVASSAVDRAMTDDEFARIGEMVSNLPVFADCDEEGLVKAAEACGKILSADDGLQQVSAGARGIAREAPRDGVLRGVHSPAANAVAGISIRKDRHKFCRVRPTFALASMRTSLS
jgi:hypothetical protein